MCCVCIPKLSVCALLPKNHLFQCLFWFYYVYIVNCVPTRCFLNVSYISINSIFSHTASLKSEFTFIDISGGSFKELIRSSLDELSANSANILVHTWLIVHVKWLCPVEGRPEK